MNDRAYWEDRLTPEEAAQYGEAILKFRKTRKTKNDQDQLYTDLTNCGIYGDEADEMINLELQA